MRIKDIRLDEALPGSRAAAELERGASRERGSPRSREAGAQTAKERLAARRERMAADKAAEKSRSAIAAPIDSTLPSKFDSGGQRWEKVDKTGTYGEPMYINRRTGEVKTYDQAVVSKKTPDTKGTEVDPYLTKGEKRSSGERPVRKPEGGGLKWEPSDVNVWRRVAKDSGIADINKIKPGQELKLPDGTTHTVKSGETLSGILRDKAPVKKTGDARIDDLNTKSDANVWSRTDPDAPRRDASGILRDKDGNPVPTILTPKEITTKGERVPPEIADRLERERTTPPRDGESIFDKVERERIEAERGKPLSGSAKIAGGAIGGGLIGAGIMDYLRDLEKKDKDPVSQTTNVPTAPTDSDTTPQDNKPETGPSTTTTQDNKPETGPSTTTTNNNKPENRPNTTTTTTNNNKPENRPNTTTTTTNNKPENRPNVSNVDDRATALRDKIAAKIKSGEYDPTNKGMYQTRKSEINPEKLGEPEVTKKPEVSKIGPEVSSSTPGQTWDTGTGGKLRSSSDDELEFKQQKGQYATYTPDWREKDAAAKAQGAENLEKLKGSKLNPMNWFNEDVGQLNRITALAGHTTKKEITESTTMNDDMRKMLQLMTEASKMADIKGKKHTGKYGKEFDTDEEGDEKSASKAEPVEKKGRGRPKKDSNVEAGKYKGADDAAKHVIGGSAPKGKSKLPSKKHTLKDWFESTEEAIVEGAKVDRMVKHIEKSERGLGKSKKEAENIAWATANKRGYLDNKNKKKVKEEKFTSNGKPVSKQTYDALMKAAGKQPSPDSVKEELKGGQKNLDKNHNGKLDSQDFKMLRTSKKKVKEGVNFAEMMKEKQMTIEEMLEGLQQEIAEFKATGHMGEKLRDALDIHRHGNKDKLMGEMSMMSQPVVEQPVEESPFTYAAKQAKASGEDSFKLGGETFPVTESEGVEESGLQAYLGNKKYGKEGMDALRKAGREGASKEKMAKIRAKYDTMDEGIGDDVAYGTGKVVGAVEKGIGDLKANFSAGRDVGKTGGPRDPSEAPMASPAERQKALEPTKPVTGREMPTVDRTYRKMKEGSITKTGPNDLTGTWSSDPPKKGQKDVPMPVPMDPVYPAEPSKQEKKPSSSKPMKESLDFSLWDNQLEKIINESLTISTTQGDHGGDDSVSVTASGAQAAEIMALLRNAGIGGMGGSDQEVSHDHDAEPEQSVSAYGVPMSSDPEQVEVGMTDDGTDMLSLIKRLTGLGLDDGEAQPEADVEVYSVGDEEGSDDYADEEDSEEDHDQEYGSGEEESDEESDEEDSEEDEEDSSEESDEEDSEDDEEKVDEGYGQADEGNAFTNKLAHTQKGDEFELDGKKYKDTSSIEEGEDMCQECGMSESECSHNRMDETDNPFQTYENLESARPIEEELANGADDQALQDIKFMIKTLAGGLNKEKRDQTTLPHTAVRAGKVNESKDMILEWKKLSGIK